MSVAIEDVPAWTVSQGIGHALTMQRGPLVHTLCRMLMWSGSAASPGPPKRICRHCREALRHPDVKLIPRAKAAGVEVIEVETGERQGCKDEKVRDHGIDDSTPADLADRSVLGAGLQTLGDRRGRSLVEVIEVGREG